MRSYDMTEPHIKMLPYYKSPAHHVPLSNKAERRIYKLDCNVQYACMPNMNALPPMEQPTWESQQTFVEAL